MRHLINSMTSLFRSVALDERHMQLCFRPLRFNAAEIHLVFQLHISVTSATCCSSATLNNPARSHCPIPPNLLSSKKKPFYFNLLVF